MGRAVAQRCLFRHSPRPAKEGRTRWGLAVLGALLEAVALSPEVSVFLFPQHFLCQKEECCLPPSAVPEPCSSVSSATSSGLTFPKAWDTAPGPVHLGQELDLQL